MNNEQSFETVYIAGELSTVEVPQELKDRIFPMIKSQQEMWIEKINSMIRESGMNKSQFAEKLGISRMALNKWCNGSVPKNRETFIRVGIAAGYNRDKMDQLLQRYGQYPGLYAKSLEDCICIYVLNQNLGDSALYVYDCILDTIKEKISGSDETESHSGSVETKTFDLILDKVTSQDELYKLIEDYSAVFASAYNKFYAYVINIIMEYTNDLYATVNEVADWQEWSSSLRQSVSAIRQKKWYPTRNKIISLGIHLNLGHDEIDEMLKLAHMEPLCAKNIFESIITFILDDADLNDMLNPDDPDYDSDALCKYAREVLNQFDMPEVEEFLTELPEDFDED